MSELVPSARFRPAPWRAVARTVHGAQHKRRGQPNQDAVGVWADEEAGNLIAAVADGHGSAKSCRSDVGAQFAIAGAIDLLRSLATDSEPIYAIIEESIWSESLRRALVDWWRDAVGQHLKEHPLTPEEVKLTASCDPYLAYGTTLLAAVVSPSGLLLVGVGDGDILAVADDGSVRRPLPGDARLFANETTSLCRHGAADDFRVRLLPRAEDEPALVMLSTDGYANSFATDAGFLQVGGDLLTLIRSEGLASVAGALEGWLNEASEQGSGDDVTVALLCRAALAGGTS